MTSRIRQSLCGEDVFNRDEGVAPTFSSRISCSGFRTDKLVIDVFMILLLYAIGMSQRQLFIAAYDIRDSKRLRKALKVIRAYASGGQKSVYECFLTKSEHAALLAEVGGVIDAAEDRFFLLKLDARSRVFTLGKAVPPQDGAFYYVG